MYPTKNNWMCLAGMLGVLCLPAFASVEIKSLRPSPTSGAQIGTTITWKATATDTGSGPLYFQWSVAAPGGPFVMIKDFNKGRLKSGVWGAPPFDWALTGIEGVYQVQVAIMDFSSGSSATKSVRFQVKPLVTGSDPVVIKTSHPLVALFSAPSCAAGSSMRVSFQQTSLATPAMATNWVNCHPPNTMTFEVGGMYATTEYQMFAQTMTSGGSVTSGPTLTFTTGTVPKAVHKTVFTAVTPAGPNTDTADSMVLLSLAAARLGYPPPPDEAIDLEGNLMWYYKTNSSDNLIRRPLPGGTFLSTETGKVFLRQVDLEGNYLKETNIFALSQQLLKMGFTDAGPCSAITKPFKVGDACMGSFHHDDIQTLPNGQTAALVDIEKIFPAGTQGDTSGLPVDIIGDGIVVMDTNWQVTWFFDTFQHDSGPPQLDINRPAVLGETCVVNQGGCPPINLLGAGIAPQAHDWLHANSLYYWPQNGDIIFSSRHQDWIMKIDYNNGNGTSNILWRLGPVGDFTFNNINNDPWPWNSHQHEVGMENAGAGPMTVFDNGNTRVSPPTGNGSSTGGYPGIGCAKPIDCSSRGMALTVDETNMTVTPVLSQYLENREKYFSGGDGSAQLLDNGNYFFLASIIYQGKKIYSHAVEVDPTPGTVNGTLVLDLEVNESYRAWQIPNLYDPPTT